MSGVRLPRPIAATLAVLLLAAAPALAGHHHRHDHGRARADVFPGLAGDTLLVVRHAEKPADAGDRGLSPAGVARAQAYASYFSHFEVDGAPAHIGALFASADSPASARPRLTLEPLSKATGLPIQQPFANKQATRFADWLAERQVRGTALIAWHHGKLPDLLAALGADPQALLPSGDWPENVYDWVIVLRYDEAGRLTEAKKIVEPGDLK